MKKIYVLLIVLLCTVRASAQLAADYNFTAFTSPFTSISGTGTASTALGIDDAVITGIPIGFTFSFCGVDYTTLSASSNGWLSLANSSSLEFNNFPSLIPSPGFLMPYWDDLAGQITSSSPAIPVYYQTTGVAPNRVFTFEWKNWTPYLYPGSIATGLATFQVKLYETTNIIDFCYGPSTFNLLNATIGIANSTADWQTLNNVSASPTPSSTVFTGDLTSSPANNQVYRWSICLPPPIVGTTSICVGATSTLTNPTTGGTWASAAPAIATIGLTSGVLTGIAAGTATISYTSTPGCVRTTVVTINPGPAALTGTASVCVGGTTSLTSASPGGTWTSSNPTVATVATSVGIINGISAGTATISYTISSGCIGTRVVTVNALPLPIVGTLTLCIGSTSSLASGTSGGTWASSNTAVVSIGAASGVATGVSVGTATISYTVSGCVTTAVASVNPAPSAIGGPSTVCVGATITQTNSVSGGTWSSSLPGIAVIIPTTGVVTGFSAGGAVISYTTGPGCVATKAIVVNPSPPASTGTLTMCSGASTTLSNTSAGGTWSSSAAGIATVGATTGIVTGVAAGTAHISYTLPSGCFTTSIVTVTASPAAITGTAVMCEGQTVTLATTTPGGLWSSSDISYAEVGIVSGVVSGIAAGTPTISYTLSSGCYAVRTVTINPSPMGIGGLFIICEGSSATLFNGTPGGTWVSSTPAVATIGATTGVMTGISAGTSSISYVLTASGCLVRNTITVNPLPAVITGTPTMCVGLTTTLANATPDGTWSSSAPGVATVDAAGVVTGVTAGTATITYTLPTLCVRTLTVTVNPLPPAITGTATVCPGLTTPLSNATAGGTWSSSTAGIATVVTGTGVVTGVTSGTATITYTLPTGCYITRVVTVHPTPAITGTASVCVGSTTTLSNSLTGGTWSSGAPGFATVGASTGVVSGLSVGTATITYTFTTGCTITRVVTINPLPAGITGTATVCTGLTTTLASVTPAGTWSSSATGIATVVAGTGVVTGVAAGTATITYTVTATGCRTTAVVTVDPLPSAITGTAETCPGYSATLSNAATGGTWSSSITSVATIDATTGVVSGLVAGTSTITYTSGVTGCYTTRIFTVHPIPPAIGGPATVCLGSTATLTNTIAGGTWASSNTAVASVVSATGVVTGVASGTAEITYTAPTGCWITRIITVNTLPASITGNTPFCQASTITLGNASAGGTWSSGNIAVATVGLSSGIVAGISGGTATITYTLPTGCVSTAIVTVNPLPGNITGTASVCLGLTTTLSTSSTGGTWSSSNTAIAPVGAGTGIVTGATAGNATITYTLPTGCLRTREVTVNPLPGGITGTASVCVGLTTVLDNPSGGGTWSSSNAAIATVVAASGAVTGVAAGTARITYTLPTSCIATVVVTVNPLPAAIGGSASVCIGATSTLTNATGGGTWSSSNTAIATIGTFTGVATGIALGNATITYRLASTGCIRTREVTVNPLPAAITGPTSVCAAGGSVTLSSTTPGGTWSSSNPAVATAASATGVITGITSGTATITYTLPTTCFTTRTVTIDPAPAAVITPLGDTTVCPGGFVPLTASTGIGYTYEWYRDGSLLAGATAASYLASISGSYTVRVFNTLACPATSIPMLVTIDTPDAAITAPGGTPVACAGTPVALEATTGTGLTYQWELDGSAISGATAATYNAAVTGDYSVVITNAAGCSAEASLAVTVNPLPVASVTLSGPLTFCSGGSVTITASSGSGYSYQWHNALGSIAGATAGAYTASASGSYFVVVTTAAGCTATSGVSVVVVNTIPSALIVPVGPTIFCTGGSVTLNASSAPGLTYQWYKGGLAITGATDAAYVASTTGGYRVQVTNTATGCSATTAADMMVTMVSSPTVVPLTPSAYCWGGGALMGTTVPAVAGVVSYQWYKNGTPVSGATASTYMATSPGNYSVEISIAPGCVLTTPVVAVSERPLPNPLVSYNATTHVLSTQTHFVTYQWYKDLVVIPGATAATTVATGNGAYKVAVTDTNGCQSFSAAFPLTTWSGGGGVGVTSVYAGEVSLYPNPVQHTLFVDAPGIVTVRISSIDGKLLITHSTGNGASIDISTLANGVYMATIATETGEVIKTEKLVKSAQ